MESRKTNSADLERKRTVFFQLGLIIAVSTALAAFEWKTPDYSRVQLPERSAIEPDEEWINIIVEKKPEPPRPVNTTLMKTVEDNRTVLVDIKVVSEIDPADFIEPYVLPELPSEEPVDNAEPFVVVEQMPEFPGGDIALRKYLAEHTVYPRMAKESGISGTVYVTFVIEKSGKVSSVDVLRGVSGGCTEEAVRVVSEMPDWNPGLQRGKPVRVRLNLPVRFMLLN